jgi:hypothetical protein
MMNPVKMKVIAMLEKPPIKNQKGAILIGLIITMVIMSISAAATYKLTSGSTLTELFKNNNLSAYYLAESGARYAAPLVMSDLNGATGTTVNIDALHGNEFTLSPGKFKIEIFDNTPNPTSLLIKSTGKINEGTWFETKRTLVYKLTKSIVGWDMNAASGSTASDLGWNLDSGQNSRIANNQQSGNTNALYIQVDNATRIGLLTPGQESGIPNYLGQLENANYAIQAKVNVSPQGSNGLFYMMGLNFRLKGATTSSDTYGVSFFRKRSYKSGNSCGNNPIYINSGGPGTPISGITYQADTNYSPNAGTPVSTTAVISGTSESSLYQTQRKGDFSYTIPKAVFCNQGNNNKGDYNVTLKFADFTSTAANQRVFKVSITGAESTPAITALDVFAQAGGRNAAYDVTVPITISNPGDMTITFESVIGEPIVNAIIIEPNRAPAWWDPESGSSCSAGSLCAAFSSSGTTFANNTLYLVLWKKTGGVFSLLGASDLTATGVRGYYSNQNCSINNPSAGGQCLLPYSTIEVAISENETQNSIIASIAAPGDPLTGTITWQFPPLIQKIPASGAITDSSPQLLSSSAPFPFNPEIGIHNYFDSPGAQNAFFADFAMKTPGGTTGLSSTGAYTQWY